MTAGGHQQNETQAILADAATMERIRQAEIEVAAGDVLSEADLRNLLASRHSTSDDQLDGWNGICTSSPPS